MHIGDHILTEQLETFRTGMLSRLPQSERQAILSAAEDLRLGVSARKSPGIGEPAPAFALPDQHGRIVRLADRLATGPLVVLFVRGGWCPFCTLTLRAYQAALPAMHAAGADLLAITPEPATSSCAVAERDLLAFPVLSDHGNAVADEYGVAYDLAPALRALYARLGHDLPRRNGTGNWRVPLPATFVIGTDGRVSHADVQPVAHRRMEPAAVVRALESLRVHA